MIVNTDSDYQGLSIYSNLQLFIFRDSQYRWYQVVYFFGGFIARTTTNFISLPYFFLLLFPLYEVRVCRACRANSIHCSSQMHLCFSSNQYIVLFHTYPSSSFWFSSKGSSAEREFLVGFRDGVQFCAFSTVTSDQYIQFLELTPRPTSLYINRLVYFLRGGERLTQ